MDASLEMYTVTWRSPSTSMFFVNQPVSGSWAAWVQSFSSAVMVSRSTPPSSYSRTATPAVLARLTVLLGDSLPSTACITPLDSAQDMASLAQLSSSPASA